MTELMLDSPPSSPGGAFLIQNTDPENIFLPEELTQKIDSEEFRTLEELKEIMAVCVGHTKAHQTSGLVPHALAEIAAQIFALESVISRMAGDEEKNWDDGTGEEYAVEHRMISVIASETYSRIADVAIQIHRMESDAETSSLINHWNDQRLRRMMRGRTETDRSTIINLLLSKDKNGRLPLLSAARDIEREIAHANDVVGVVKTGCPQNGMEAAACNCKRLALFLFAKTTGCLGPDLLDAPEIAAAIASVICSAYIVESVALRTRKMRLLGQDDLETALLAAQVATRDYLDAAVSSASYALDSLPCEIGTDWRTGSYSGLTDLMARLSRPVVRPVPLRRALAQQVLERENYSI